MGLLRTISILITLVVPALLSRAQDPAEGEYAVGYTCGWQRLRLFADGRALQTIGGRSGDRKRVGTWARHWDTVTVLFHSEYDVVTKGVRPLKDTNVYCARNRYRLDQIHDDWLVHRFEKVAEYYSGSRPMLSVTDSTSGSNSWKVYTSYYENGQVKHRVCFRGTRIDGPERMYHPNGNIAAQAMWKRGKLIGSRKYYDSHGALLKEQRF